MTPIDALATKSNEVTRRCNFLYSGISAGMVIRNVVAPDPSRCANIAISEVTINKSVILLPAAPTSFLIILSNMPASDMIPKYVTEKMKSAAVFQVEVTPLVTNSAISVGVNPTKIAATEEAIQTQQQG